MHLKRQGQFICRALSYHGCNFHVDEQALSPETLRVYDQAAELWIRLHGKLTMSLATGGLSNYARRGAKRAAARKRKGGSSGNASDGTASPSVSGTVDSGAGSDDSDDGSESGDDSDDSDVESEERSSDSDFDESDEEDEDGFRGLKLPAKDEAAQRMLMRYFWGKRTEQHAPCT